MLHVHYRTSVTIFEAAVHKEWGEKKKKSYYILEIQEAQQRVNKSKVGRPQKKAQHSPAYPWVPNKPKVRNKN